jgi:hypothetical protein
MIFFKVKFTYSNKKKNKILLKKKIKIYIFFLIELIWFYQFYNNNAESKVIDINKITTPAI